ncbi:MAG TPA: shikimate kinase [Acidimicrobiales bacterium]|nr:shikimate kinase [Acidimicrobiales bacterium]
MPERLYLVGMMGSGKTTVARLVATRLGWVSLDSDEQVCRRTGRTVREIFETDGEAAFRGEESAALREAARAAPDTPAVVAVAGGAVIEAANRALLSESGPVVWLDVPPSVLAGRVRAGVDHRPLLGDDPATALERLERQRRPLYEEIADLVVDASVRTPTQIAAEIVEWYEERKMAP